MAKADNYKQLYEQTKKILSKYQDELVPGFRKSIEELNEIVANQRWRASVAEDFICTMCSECKWEVHDGILVMQKSCCGFFPECEKFKLRSGWIPVTELLPDTFGVFIVAIREPYKERAWKDCADFDPFTKKWLPSMCWDKGYEVTHWMPLPNPPEEENK